jgi:hypothetical protein
VTLCHLQKPPRTYVEKSLQAILHHSGNSVQQGCPGDRDDNLWVTIDDYKPPETQVEWEETCFLDEPFHGYYMWPTTVRYAVNKRERYAINNMPEQVAVIYNCFTDKDFVSRTIEMMVLDEKKDKENFNEEEDTVKFDEIQFMLFKVNKNRAQLSHSF